MMKEEGSHVFRLNMAWRWIPVIFVICACPDLWEAIRIYRGLGEVVWGRTLWAAMLLLTGAFYCFYYWRFRLNVDGAGIRVRHFLRPSLFLAWSCVTEAFQGKDGINEWLVLKSDAGKICAGKLELGKRRYGQLCSLVQERLTSTDQGALHEEGGFLPLDGREMKWERWRYHRCLPLLLFCIIGALHPVDRDSLPEDMDIGLILYCGIRHERDVEKAASYLDGNTMELLAQALNRPEMILPWDEMPHGESSRYFGRKEKEAYLVGCLKAGGLLKEVPGTAEQWLRYGRFYRPEHAILRRLDE